MRLPNDAVANQHWAIKSIAYELTATGVKVVATSIQPCHLWMRWSITYPQVHKIPRYRRGIWLFDDHRFCFVVFVDNEQEEAGDTYIHTFIKEPWPVCQTRYFYFHGKVDGNSSPSTSAIFSYHRAYAPEEFLLVFTDLWSGEASYNDWDFQPLTTRGISTAYYISPPSSLRLKKPASPDWDNTWLLCRHADTLLLPAGRIQTWYYTDSAYFWWKWLIFRNQLPLGSAGFNGAFYIGWNGQNLQYTDGYGTTFRTVALALPTDTWHHMRVTWYSGLKDSLPCINVQVEREVAGSWVPCDILVQRTPDLNVGSSINRIGIGCNAHYLIPEHFDNTVVFKKQF